MRFNPLTPQNVSLFRRSNPPENLHSTLKSLVQNGQYREALQLYTKEGSRSTPPPLSHLIFPPLLKACTALSATPHGKTIHAHTIEMGLQFDPYIATSLVNIYVKSGYLGYAAKVFVKLSECSVVDVTLWNAMIDGYFKFREFYLGLAHVYRMQLSGVRPDMFTLTILLGACGGVSCSVSCALGRQIHGFVVRNVSRNDPFLETALISMYSSCGRVDRAWNIFQKMEDKSSVAVWNAMMAGFCGNGIWESSLELFLLAKRCNCGLSSGSFVSALTACSQGGSVASGQQIHLDVVKSGFEHDPFVCTSLLTMYARCGFVEDAEWVFHDVPDKRIELWNAMISGYVNNGCEYDVSKVFVRLKSSGILPDPVTFSNILSACSVNDLYDFGTAVHAELIKKPLQNNVAIQSALLTLYSKHGITKNAKAIFSMIEEKDVVAWGSMISGFYQNGSLDESFDLFRAMLADAVKPDSDIMASVICACTGHDDVHLGSAIHGFSSKSGFESDVFVASSLIDMYSKGGFLEDAERVFSLMPYKNLVAWNSMISCYCKNKKPEMSISLFHQIELHGLRPDSISFTTVLVAVSSLAGLTKGKEIHGYLIRNSIHDLQVENSVIDMYTKSGSLSYARSIFNAMPTKNLVTWNSIISGYGSHSECLEAIKLFDEMKTSGMRPDEVTFLSLITSCSHSGLVDEGLGLFHSMKPQYQIEPKMEHFMNVVDLLGRAGRLEEAYRFIQNIPIEPDQNMWRCLLGACCTHRNLELGELAAHNLCRTEAARSSDFVQLLNLYGEAGLRDKAARLRMGMKEMGLKKLPGYSWIQVRNETNAFVSGDSSSPYAREIFEMLNRLTSDMGSYEEDYEDSRVEL